METQDAHSPANWRPDHVVLQKKGDPPFKVKPQSVIAAFVAIGWDHSRYNAEAESVILRMNRQLQPRFWKAIDESSVPITVKGGVVICDAMTDTGFPDPRSLPSALEKLGLKQPFSIVVNMPTISFDAGKTAVKILAGFAFRDQIQRMVFLSDDGCVPQ